MNWLLLTLLAISSRATYSIATKILSKDVKVSPITHSVLLTSFAGLISLLASPLAGGLDFSKIFIYPIPTVLMVTSQAFGNLLYYKGIKKLDAGTAQIAFSTILIWGAILSAAFLDSSFSLIQLFGILLMFVSIMLVQYKKGKIDLTSSFILMIASAVLFAVFQVTSADLSKILTTGTYLVTAYLGPSLIIGLVYFNTVKNDFNFIKIQLRKTFFITLFTSGTSLLYFLFSYLAYRYAPDRGVVVVLLTSQVVLSVILGIIFLKEKENMAKKLTAGLLAFIAGALIKSS